jgi:hypothetical protein
MPAGRAFVRFGCLALMLIVAGCSDPASPTSGAAATPLAGKAPPSSAPTVTSTLPSEATRDTTLDVQITGSGFDSGSRASFERNGVVDPRVRVNSTRFVKSTSIVANVTIAADAETEFYDVAVVTGGGKKGIGTELFAVTVRPIGLLGGDRVTALNSLGEAVGWGPRSKACNDLSTPMFWGADGTPVALPLGTFCGGTPNAINGSGVILGALFGGAPNASGLWTPTGSGYTLQEIPPAPDGYRPITGNINDAGEVTGWGQGGAKLFWWSASTGWIPMRVPEGATACQVFDAINNLGAIAGKCSIGGNAFDGYYWADHNATPTLLPRPGATGDVNPHDINDAGVIVGYLYGSSTRAVKWTPSGSGYTVSFLPDLGIKSAAYAIAQDGTVSGYITRTNGFARPALWSAAGELIVLGLNKNGDTGEATDVAVTPTGIVVGGVLTSLGSTLWKITP